MRAMFAEHVTILFRVETLEILIDLRVAHGGSGHINEKILLGDIGHIFRVIIFGEQMIERLVAARA